MKNIALIIGTVGGIISSFIGGWTTGMSTLLIFMCVDYITGLMVAGIFNKSKKTENGKLSSKVGWKGLCRKGMTMLMVLVACRVDIYLNTHFCRDGVVIAYVANELLSIVENAGLMGVPVPKILKKAIDIFEKEEEI